MCTVCFLNVSSDFGTIRCKVQRNMLNNLSFTKVDVMMSILPSGLSSFLLALSTFTAYQCKMSEHCAVQLSVCDCRDNQSRGRILLLRASVTLHVRVLHDAV